jgi:hypothetical protein
MIKTLIGKIYTDNSRKANTITSDIKQYSRVIFLAIVYRDII